MQFALGQDRQLYHVDCHRQKFHPKCSVCTSLLPCGPDGIIRFHHNPYWKNRLGPQLLPAA